MGGRRCCICLFDGVMEKGKVLATSALLVLVWTWLRGKKTCSSSNASWWNKTRKDIATMSARTIECTCQEVKGYSDTDVAEYMYSSKPQIDALVDYLCMDSTRACSTKPPLLYFLRIGFQEKRLCPSQLKKLRRKP